MPSDFEMEDSDSSNESLNIDPSILASVTQGRPRVIFKGKEYQRYYGARATRAPSVIWSTGEEYERNGKKHWRCGICKTDKMLAISSGTSSALRHLKQRHKIDKAGQRIQKQPTIVEALSVAGKVAKTVAHVVTRFNLHTFRYLLVRWVVTMHIAFSCVESDTFRDWVLYIAPALEPCLVRSGRTIRRWILWEFEKQRNYVKKQLATARSRIHISFDLWTSPNSKGLVGVVFHYLDQDLKVRSLLAGVRRVKGHHSGENIAEAVIPVLQTMISSDQIGYFIGDNDGRNDTAIRAILAQLRPDLKDPDSRRVRCLGHIINLAAKAFLFGKDADAFEEESQSKKQLDKLEAVRELWRKKGPLGKLHNTVLFIRKTPQRREAFSSICGKEITAEIEGRFKEPYKATLNTRLTNFRSPHGHRRQRDSLEFNLPINSTGNLAL